MTLGVATGMVAALACDSEEDGVVACYYEVRSTGCNDSQWGEWDPRCTEIENGKPCTEVASNTTTCEAGCCVDFQYRDHTEVGGPCDDE